MFYPGGSRRTNGSTDSVIMMEFLQTNYLIGSSFDSQAIGFTKEIDVCNKVEDQPRHFFSNCWLGVSSDWAHKVSYVHLNVILAIMEFSHRLVEKKCAVQLMTLFVFLSLMMKFLQTFYLIASSSDSQTIRFTSKIDVCDKVEDLPKTVFLKSMVGSFIWPNT